MPTLGHSDTESRLQGHYYFISNISSQNIYPNLISCSNRLLASGDVIGQQNRSGEKSRGAKENTNLRISHREGAKDIVPQPTQQATGKQKEERHFHTILRIYTQDLVCNPKLYNSLIGFFISSF